MGKVFKRPAEENARTIMRYERDVLEEQSADLLTALDGDAAYLDPAMLRAAVLTEARADAERKVQDAFAEGRRRGMEAGRTEFMQSVAGAVQSLHAAAEAIRNAHEEFLASLEPQVLHLVRRIVERVLDREMRADPDLVLRTARRALRCVTDRARLTVRVHPSDLETLRVHRVALLEEFDVVGQMSIEADENVSPGGCLVDSEMLHVDARLEHLLEKILEELAD